jgi:deazaflavin-dependent oxidoreductase (nitroreductase family)
LIDLREDWKVKGKKHVGEYINDILTYLSKPGDALFLLSLFLSCAPSGNPYNHQSILSTISHANHLNRRLLMDERVKDALARDRTIDITTRGRKTGQLHRTELWFHYIDGHVYITGTPGRRDWYANLLAHPEFTFHLKQSTKADLPARATPILDRARRRAIIASIDQKLGGSRDLDAWVEGGPLVAVELLVE